MFVRTSVQMQKQVAMGSLGHGLQENFGIIELPRSILSLLLGHTVALNQEHFNQPFATNLHTEWSHCTTSTKHAYIEIRGALRPH